MSFALANSLSGIHKFKIVCSTDRERVRHAEKKERDKGRQRNSFPCCRLGL
jgi:hypothetical protein